MLVSSGRFNAKIVNISAVLALNSSLLRGFYSVMKVYVKYVHTSFELTKMRVSSGRFSTKIINISAVLALNSSLLRGFYSAMKQFVLIVLRRL